METQEDNSSTKPNTNNKFRLLFFISLFISIIFIVLLVIVWRDYFSQSAKLNQMLNEVDLKYSQCLKSNKSVNVTKDPNSLDEEEVIDSKEYNGRTYNLYYAVPPYTIFTPPVLVLTEEEVNGSVELLVIGVTAESTDFVHDKVFDFAKGKLYVINNQNNAIDVYRIIDDYDIEPIKSVSLPNYETGFLYGIICSAEHCTAKTAFHFESGCDVELDVATDTFGVPTCFNPGPDGAEFTPEKK